MFFVDVMSDRNYKFTLKLKKVEFCLSMSVSGQRVRRSINTS